MNTEKSFIKNENSILGSRAISLSSQSRQKCKQVLT